MASKDIKKNIVIDTVASTHLLIIWLILIVSVPRRCKKNRPHSPLVMMHIHPSMLNHLQNRFFSFLKNLYGKNVEIWLFSARVTMKKGDSLNFILHFELKPLYANALASRIVLLLPLYDYDYYSRTNRA